jgi:NAD(P)-dependent dehydrogenase (short-subunit alcohol dehydrogenase family)
MAGSAMGDERGGDAMTSLEGQVALVTGAGQGLGRACARLFAREGAKLVIADINDDKGEETAAMICKGGGEAIFIHADVARSQDVQAMVQAAIDRFGGLDCAVNNAMLSVGYGPLHEIDKAAWDRGVAVNLSGVFRCMKYEIKAMLARGGGAIVNIGSGRENTGKGGLSWYLAAKQGVYGITKCAALDYGAQNIRINAVAPGPMWTPAMRKTMAENPGHMERRAAEVPLGRIGEAEDVAEAVVWLCSPRAGYVHGATLSADGGYILAK